MSGTQNRVRHAFDQVFASATTAVAGLTGLAAVVALTRRLLRAGR